MSVYLNHFGLNCEPFSIVPDPGFLYPSSHHRQAVAHLKYGLDREGGFILLTGEVGTGKTTLTRTMLKRLPAHVRVAYVLNSKLVVTDVLASICDELSIELPDNQELSFSKTCIDALNEDLIQTHADGKKTLVVIEEAQNLSADVLETLRLLSNLETTTHKLLHILLVGQPELLEILAQKDQRQLNQRVVSRFHLLPLEKNELANYVNHRLHRAGASRSLFDHAALGALFRLTKGVPRLINLICHHCLLAAYATGAKTVSADLVKKAAVEILGDHTTVSKAPNKWLWIAVLVFVLVAGGVFLGSEKFPYRSGFESLGLPQTLDNQIEVNSASDLVTETLGQRGLVTDLPASKPESGSSQSTLANPFAALFAIWSVDTDALFSEEEAAAVAIYHGLGIEKLEDTNWAVIEMIDRPGIVWLKDGKGRVKSYLLASVSGQDLKLVSIAGPHVMSMQDFRQRWTGVFMYLWRAPNELQSLRLGDINSKALTWLQNSLQKADSNYQQIITAGRYNEAIQQQVLLFQQQQGIKADGVVGPQTIMKLNQLMDTSIPRLLIRDAGVGQKDSRRHDEEQVGWINGD